MGSTSVKERQAGDLVAVLLTAGRSCRTGLLGLGVLAALACAGPLEPAADPEPDPDPTPTSGSAPTAVPSLRIGTSGDYAPFSHWPADAREPEGFSVAVARAFAADRGEQIEWVRFRWSDLAADLEAGRFELALSGITVRPDRSALGRFSLPLTTTGAVALVLASSPIETPAELEQAGLRIAVNRGGHLERVARMLFGRARIEAVDGNLAVPARLADGRADAVLTDDLEARVWQPALPPTRVIGPLTRDRKAAWFPPGEEALLRDFDRWLLAAEASGALAQLRRQHGLGNLRTADVRPALLARLDERLALMPEIARAKQTLARPIEDPAQEARVHAAARESAERAALELAVAPPAEPSLHRFVDALLAAARFIQTRTLTDDRAAGGASPNDASDAAARRAEQARIEIDERLRPAAAFLMDRIIGLAVATTQAGVAPRADRALPTAAAAGRPSASVAAVADALATHALPPELVAEIDAALEALATRSETNRSLVKPPRRATTSARAGPTRPAPPDTSPSA